MRNILVVSHVRSADMSNGGAVYTYTICKMIENVIKDATIKEMYFTGTKTRRWRSYNKIAALLKSFVSSEPSKGLYFRSEGFASKILEELEKPYALVVIVHAEMLWVKDIVPGNVPVVHLSQNIEHLLFAEYIGRYLSIPFIGKFLKNDSKKYERYETEYVKKIKNLITVSVDDKLFFGEFSEQMNVAVVNPAFSYERQERRIERNRVDALKMGFVGNLEWWPNRDAVTWMITEVMPKLTGGKELHLYGKGSEKFNGEGAVFGHGFVADINEVWQSVDIMVNPITSGGGVNIKVIEAIYNKMPMVCTQKAIRGIDLLPDDSVAILDDPSEWADFLNSEVKVNALLSNRCFPNADIFAMAAQEERLGNFLEGIMKNEI